MRTLIAALAFLLVPTTADAQPIEGTWSTQHEGGGQSWIQIQHTPNGVLSKALYMNPEGKCLGTGFTERSWEGNELRMPNTNTSWTVIRESRNRATIIFPNSRGQPVAKTYWKDPKANPPELCKGGGRSV